MWRVGDVVCIASVLSFIRGWWRLGKYPKVTPVYLYLFPESTTHSHKQFTRSLATYKKLTLFAGFPNRFLWLQFYFSGGQYSAKKNTKLCLLEEKIQLPKSKIKNNDFFYCISIKKRVKEKHFFVFLYCCKL